MRLKEDKIKFYYRGTDLPEDIIIVSAKLNTKHGDKELIKNKIDKYIKEKRVTT